MIEELNKKLEILELEKIKEILPDYIHKTSKEQPTTYRIFKLFIKRRNII